MIPTLTHNSDIVSDISSGNIYDILSGILSDICSDIQSGRLYGILSDIYTGTCVDTFFSGMSSGPGPLHSIRSSRYGVEGQAHSTAFGAGDMAASAASAACEVEAKEEEDNMKKNKKKKKKKKERKKRKRSGTFVKIWRPSPGRLAVGEQYKHIYKYHLVI